ncbi:QsdR family transcriptional regulator [Nocardia sp. NPDC003482]
MRVGAEQRGRGRPGGASRAEVLGAARAMYRGGERIELSALSARLGVSRPSIYRWFGSREGLVGEVVADELSELARTVTGEGTTPSDAVMRLVHALAAARPLRRFLEQEGLVALRVLTSSAGHVQPRAVALLTRFIDREVEAERLRPVSDSATLAFAVVRLVEGFLYNDAAVGVRADIDRLRPLLEVLLAPAD